MAPVPPRRLPDLHPNAVTAHPHERSALLPWLFPLVYLTLTQSTTALMIAVGLFGNPGLAADIALVQGATMATFYAFSANTRSLILGQSGSVSLADILRMRLVLVVPLAVAALLLALAGPAVAQWLAVCIVVRRCAEWFNDLQLCKAEVEHDARFARTFLVGQAALLALAAVGLAFGWPYAPVALGAWAVLPLVSALPLWRELRGAARKPLRGMLSTLLPHAGATAISGLALYAFRIVVVLLIARELAGELFTAVAIGSFLGTLFANVLGPSIELHRQRTGSGIPRPMKVAMWLVLVVGVAITATALLMPEGVRVAGKQQFFWLACGLSLIGGVVMVAAQRVRLRVLRGDEGRDLFGPEILVHVGLLVSALLATRLGGPLGATSLYLVNAALAYVFYKSSEVALRRTASGAHPVFERLRLAIVFLIALPLFFQLIGGIYNAAKPVADSGGALITLPLPVSLLACFGGIVLLADYRRATRSFAFLFLLFAAMLLSTVVTTPTGEPFDRAKLLLFLQVLIPAFGLALGEMVEPEPAQRALVIERALFWACAIVMPAQLFSTWLQGEATLAHGIGVFAIYQHREYVPVVLASAALVAAGGLLHHPAYRPWTYPLLVVSVVYVLATYSLLAIAVAGAGLVVFVMRQPPRTVLKQSIAAAAVAIAAIGMQLAVLHGTGHYYSKIFTYEKLTRSVTAPCTSEALIFASPSIIAEGDVCVIRRTDSDGPQKVLVLFQHAMAKGDVLVVEGELREGGLTVLLVRQDGSVLAERAATKRGPFALELTADAEQGLINAAVLSNLPPSPADDWSITRVYWRLAVLPKLAGGAPMAPDWAKRLLPLNAAERVGDWILFGRPIFSSVETVLFGHDKPIDRLIRSSPHNYYIDLAYNFGVLTLLPIFLLIAYTARAIWQRRREVWQVDRLTALVAVVLFLVVIDSNFKVTLRQPYPGIFAFFLWGVLLARLRTRDTTALASTDDARAPQSSGGTLTR